MMTEMSTTVMNSPTTNEMTNTRTVRFRTWMRLGHETFLSSDHDSLMNCRKRFTAPFSLDYGELWQGR